MTKPNRLVAGSRYFYCTYFDKDLLVPDIRTLQFVEEIRDDAGIRMWQFKTPQSEVADPQEIDPEQYLAFPEEQLDEVLEIEDLAHRVAELIEMDRRASKAQPDTRHNADPILSLSAEAVSRIAELVTSKADSSMHIGVRYTDDAFLLNRRDGKLRIHFYTRPLRHPEQNLLIEKICEESGLRTVDDYLADAGRTRILSYALDEDLTKIADIASELLRRAYNATADDEIEIK